MEFESQSITTAHPQVLHQQLTFPHPIPSIPRGAQQSKQPDGHVTDQNLGCNHIHSPKTTQQSPQPIHLCDQLHPGSSKDQEESSSYIQQRQARQSNKAQHSEDEDKPWPVTKEEAKVLTWLYQIIKGIEKCCWKKQKICPFWCPFDTNKQTKINHL